MSRNIQDLDITKYQRYAAVPFIGVNRIEFTVENNKVLCENVDFYDLEDKTILAFKDEECFFGYHNYEASSDEQSKVMQTSCYNYLKNIINLQSEYPTTIFSFNDSKIIPQVNPDPKSSPLISSTTGEQAPRCDLNKFGPYPFYTRVGQYRIKNIKMLLSLTGTAHIIALESPDENIKFPNAQGVNTIALTIAGIIAMVHEWSQCAEPPFNSTENIALKAKMFLDGLGLSSIANEISSTQAPMRVKKYLGGETNMTAELSEIKFMTDSLRHYMLSTTMYSSLNSLQNNYPNNLNIPANKKEQEIDYLLNYIYQYCIESGIEVQSASIDNVYNIMMNDNRFSTSENQNDVETHMYRSILKMYSM